MKVDAENVQGTRDDEAAKRAGLSLVEAGRDKSMQVHKKQPNLHAVLTMFL